MKKQIRNAVFAAVDKIADLGFVQVGRRHSLESADLPAALIYTDSENIGRSDTDCLMHIVELKLNVYVKPDGETAGEDDLDDLISKIDAVVIPAVDAISGVVDMLPESFDVDADGDADADYLMGTRTYMIEFFTTEL